MWKFEAGPKKRRRPESWSKERWPRVERSMWTRPSFLEAWIRGGGCVSMMLLERLLSFWYPLSPSVDSSCMLRGVVFCWGGWDWFESLLFWEVVASARVLGG